MNEPLRLPPERLPREVFLASLGQIQDQMEKLYLLTGLGTPEDSPIRVSQCYREGGPGLSAQTATPRNLTLHKRMMDGLMDAWMEIHKTIKQLNWVIYYA